MTDHTGPRAVDGFAGVPLTLTDGTKVVARPLPMSEAAAFWEAYLDATSDDVEKVTRGLLILQRDLPEALGLKAEFDRHVSAPDMFRVFADFFWGRLRERANGTTELPHAAPAEPTAQPVAVGQPTETIGA